MLRERAGEREPARAHNRLERAKIASRSAPRCLERANIASGSAFRRSNELLERSKDDPGSILIDLSSILDPQRVDLGALATLKIELSHARELNFRVFTVLPLKTAFRAQLAGS